MDFLLKLSETKLDEFVDELDNISSEKNKLYKLVETASGRLAALHVSCWMMANNDKKVVTSGQFKSNIKAIDAFICDCDEKDWDMITVEPKTVYAILTVGSWLYDEDGFMSRIFNSFMEFESKEKFNSNNTQQLRNIFNSFKNAAIDKYKQSDIFKMTKVESVQLQLVEEGA